MNEPDRVKLLESYQSQGAYCSYISGKCAYGNNVLACAKRNPVECRKCRQAKQS